MAGSVEASALQAPAAQLLPDSQAGPRFPAPLRHLARGELGLQAPPAPALLQAHGGHGPPPQILPGSPAGAPPAPGRRVHLHRTRRGPLPGREEVPARRPQSRPGAEEEILKTKFKNNSVPLCYCCYYKRHPLGRHHRQY